MSLSVVQQQRTIAEETLSATTGHKLRMGLFAQLHISITADRYSNGTPGAIRILSSARDNFYIRCGIPLLQLVAARLYCCTVHSKTKSKHRSFPTYMLA